jgi:hypothetical protein
MDDNEKIKVTGFEEESSKRDCFIKAIEIDN